MSECQTCVPVDCSNPDDKLLYSLDNLQVRNGVMSFVRECPDGYRCPEPLLYPITVLIPANVVTVYIPPVGSIGNGPLRLMGCQCEITRAVPDDATTADLIVLANEMIEEWGGQFANCRVLEPPYPGREAPVPI